MKLYILDLDHCLIFASYKEIEGIECVAKRKWHFLYHRPGLQQFLKYIQKTGDIIFYTSSKMEYAKWVVASFNLQNKSVIYARKYCKRKHTDFGVIYLKSIFQLPIKKEYSRIIVLDDRTDFWDDIGVELHDIKPFMGEIEDNELLRWQILQLKKQPKMGISFPKE